MQGGSWEGGFFSPGCPSEPGFLSLGLPSPGGLFSDFAKLAGQHPVCPTGVRKAIEKN